MSYVNEFIKRTGMTSEDDSFGDDDLSAVFRPYDGCASLDIGNVALNRRHADEIPEPKGLLEQ